jgi:hypothetical protein
MPSSFVHVVAVTALCWGTIAVAVEQRNEVFRVHSCTNEAFFWRHNDSYRSGAALHISHGAQHDVLLRRGHEDPAHVDHEFEGFSLRHVSHPPRTEPTQEYYAPYTARSLWRLLRTIEWTHILHEATYDVLASPLVPWDQKGVQLQRMVDHYLAANDVALSCAPLDLVMRRTGVMMKPYFTVFRTTYPASNNFFYAAHWWHPVTYEAMMIGGQGQAQDAAVDEIEVVFKQQVLRNRPMRMLLSREVMPRYARLSPQSANVFDCLHMLHGIVYDILAYQGWTLEQKHDEIYRVLHAMANRPGDERLARKFTMPHPEQDPRRYEAWMREGPGEMGRMMIEMHDEMMPPGDDAAAKAAHAKMTGILKDKLMPGRAGNEPAGSFMDALAKLMPEKPMPKSPAHEPGKSDPHMMHMMVNAWMKRSADMPDAPDFPLTPAPTRTSP